MTTTIYLSKITQNKIWVLKDKKQKRKFKGKRYLNPKVNN